MNKDQYQVIWLVRRLFRALSHKSSENLEGLDVTVADRAVMEFLYPDNKLSVPEIAERYKVTRQHVQVTVNSLLDKKLAVTRDNPRHKRSPLIMLNKKGRNLFDSIMQKDSAVIKELFSAITSKDIRTTRLTLEILLKKLS